MTLHLQAVQVATGHDEEGLLVFADDGRLVAVLTCLSDQHGKMTGQWFLEAGFGSLDGLDHPTFGSLDAAQDWISQRMAQRQGLGWSTN